MKNETTHGRASRTMAVSFDTIGIMKKTKTQHQLRLEYGGVPKKVVSYNIPETLVELVREAAAKSGVSASAYLSAYLARGADSIVPMSKDEIKAEGGANVKHAA